MKYAVQYNRNGHPAKTRMMTDDWHRAIAHFDKVANDPNVTNVELTEVHVLASTKMEETTNA